MDISESWLQVQLSWIVQTPTGKDQVVLKQETTLHNKLLYFAHSSLEREKKIKGIKESPPYPHMSSSQESYFF